MNNPKPTCDPQWRQKYAATIAGADEAVRKIRPGQRIFIGTGCGQPRELVGALTKRAYELPDSEIVHLLTFGEAPYARKDLTGYFRVNSFFITENIYGLIREGLSDYTPTFLSDIPHLFNSGKLPLDVALIQVTPPDEYGLCSLGVAVDVVKSAIANASLVIAQVNSNMPRTLGDSCVHVHDIDVLVPTETPIPEVTLPSANGCTRQIAEYLAALIENGSTIEAGIGYLPQTLLPYLKDKKDLGIHTEMITDGVRELIECGAVTGARKTIDRGKVVASFCVGTKQLYDFVDRNPAIAFYPTEYVNDQAVIQKQYKMVAINAALEVDLTGQVCAGAPGAEFFGGVGGQADFSRGAAKSRGGKAIIVLPATTADGAGSRIVTRLSPGAGVVMANAGVQYVVTEYGVAYLYGKSISERAMALISIAHPKFRAQLLREAVAAKYLSAGLADKEGLIVVAAKEMRVTYLLKDGTQILFRPIHPTDMARMREHFYGLSEQSIYNRFMRTVKGISRKQIEDFVYVDHRNDVCIVGVLPEAYGEQIIAIGSYYLDPKTNWAEVAFTVHDKWQRRGLGSFLLSYLIRIARRNGISGFAAEVLVENKPMLAVLNKADCTVHSQLIGDVYSFRLEFEALS
ncbi:MAG: GNAT family N-acetyltransferase [Lentisphaerae bacterium]|nr:GNAT family N-acetyltransferase [Lentisphaerota bacterium]